MHDICNNIKSGINSFRDLNLNSGSVVVIKPNLCCIKPPETGATTDVRVVEAIINCLKNEFDVSNVYIVESDGAQVLADVAFKLLGYKKLSKRLNVKLVNLSESPFSFKFFPDNTFIKEVRVPKIIEDADFFISVPKIKTHADCVFTCALKNQYGCNPYPYKTIYHKRLDDAIVDLNMAFKPDLVIVDGIVAMDGWKGPTDGVPVKMSTLIFGRDAVAVDHVVARIIGIDPNNVRYIVEAERRGLGKTMYKTIGVSIQEIKKKFNTKPPRWYNLYGLLSQDI
jgi:uncharacterized protein (DUF362 family)